MSGPAPFNFLNPPIGTGKSSLVKKTSKRPLEKFFKSRFEVFFFCNSSIQIDGFIKKTINGSGHLHP